MIKWFRIFWKKMTVFFENYNLNATEYILVTFCLIIVGIVLLILYFKLCFNLIENAVRNKNEGIAIFGIILSGIIPGLVWYNKISNKEVAKTKLKN